MRLLLIFTGIMILWLFVMIIPPKQSRSKEKHDFFFTTDVTMAPAEVLACYADCWDIEDTFKNTKQLLFCRLYLQIGLMV